MIEQEVAKKLATNVNSGLHVVE